MRTATAPAGTHGWGPTDFQDVGSPVAWPVGVTVTRVRRVHASENVVMHIVPGMALGIT